MLKSAISEHTNFVMSGCMCGWDSEFIPLFNLAVFVRTPTDMRIERLHKREFKEFGKRILEGGDMYNVHMDFLKWAGEYDTAKPPQRCLMLHKTWAKSLNCPVIHINGNDDINENIRLIIQEYSLLK